MDDVRFWSVVAALGPELAPARLALVLNSLSPTDLDAFCVCLADAEHELDTSAHRVQAGTAFELAGTGGRPRAWTEPEDERSADFGELQITVVAHGRDAWRAVVAVPPLLSGGWPTGLGRQFLLAVAYAWRRAFPDLHPA